MSVRKRVQDFHSRSLESELLAGGDTGMAVKRPAGTLVVEFNRTKVLPFGMFLPLVPIAIISRIRWLFSEQTWTVAVRTTKFDTTLFGRTVFEQTVATKAEGRLLASFVVRKCKAGAFDDRFG